MIIDSESPRPLPALTGAVSSEGREPHDRSDLSAPVLGEAAGCRGNTRVGVLVFFILRDADGPSLDRFDSLFGHMTKPFNQANRPNSGFISAVPSLKCLRDHNTLVSHCPTSHQALGLFTWLCFGLERAGPGPCPGEMGFFFSFFFFFLLKS